MIIFTEKCFHTAKKKSSQFQVRNEDNFQEKETYKLSDTQPVYYLTEKEKEISQNNLKGMSCMIYTNTYTACVPNRFRNEQ